MLYVYLNTYYIFCLIVWASTSHDTTWYINKQIQELTPLANICSKVVFQRYDSNATESSNDNYVTASSHFLKQSSFSYPATILFQMDTNCGVAKFKQKKKVQHSLSEN